MSEATTGVPAANASVSTMPKLSPPSDGAQTHIGPRELGELALLGDLAERLHAAAVEHHVRDLLRARADEREGRRDRLAQRLERPQQDRQALALHRLADEQDPQRPVARRRRTMSGTQAGAPRWG